MLIGWKKLEFVLLCFPLLVSYSFCVHISSGKGRLSERNLEKVDGARSAVECVLRCQQKKKNAFYGDDCSCGCFEGDGGNLQNDDVINGYKYLKSQNIVVSQQGGSFSLEEFNLTKHAEGKIVNIIPETVNNFIMTFNVMFQVSDHDITQLLAFDGARPQITMDHNWMRFKNNQDSKKFQLRPNKNYHIKVRKYQYAGAHACRICFLIDNVVHWIVGDGIGTETDTKVLLGDPFYRLPSASAVVSNLHYQPKQDYYGVGAEVYLPKQSAVVEYIANWPPPNWHVSFRLTLLEDFPSWSGVLLFSTRVGNGAVGNRIPSCQIGPGNMVVIKTHIGNDGDKILFEKHLPKQTQIHITIEQKIIGGQAYVKGYINSVEQANMLHSGYSSMPVPVEVSFLESNKLLVVKDLEYK
eukprot:TCONS_00025505-protein